MTNSRSPSTGSFKRGKRRGQMHKLPAPEMNYSLQCPLKAVQRTGSLTEKGSREGKHWKIKP